jgi:signal transduction histidine kinase
MRLRTKLVVVLLVVAVLLTGGVYAATEWVERQQVRATEQSTQDSAEQVADQLDGTLLTYQDTVDYYGSRFDGDGGTEDRSELAAVVQGNRFIEGGTLIAANGTVIAHRGTLPETNGSELGTVGANVSDHPAFVQPQGALAERNVYIGEPRRIADQDLPEGVSEYSGEYYVTLSTVTVDVTGDVRAVFVAFVPIGERTGFAALSALNTSTQSAALIAGDRRVFESGGSYERNVTGRAVVGQTGWVVEVTQDRAPLERTRRQLAFAQALGVLGVVGIVGGFGFWEYRTNLRQTRRLLDAFERAAAGEYDHELDLGSGDEWERIGEGYNDLTEGLAEREQALREREQRLNVLNRVLRHNLRNEMTVVVGHAEFIAEEGDEILERSAESILSSTDDLTSLSERAREIQEIRGTADERTAVDAADLASEAVADAREEFPDVEIDLDAAPAPLRAVPTVGVAVDHVVDNACRHNEGDTRRVRVSTGTGTRDGAPVAWIAVQDDGPGLPEQEQTVLREGRETALEHGSGLGLWVVYWVVRESGGTLGFDVRDGEGTRVTLEFPADAAALDATGESEAGDTGDAADPDGTPAGAE